MIPRKRHYDPQLFTSFHTPDLPVTATTQVAARRPGASVLGAYIDAVTWEEVLQTISQWAVRKESRYVCACNVHSVVTAKQNINFNFIINGADLAIPDGMPVAMMLRAKGFAGQARIDGPDLMWRYCQWAARSGQSVYLYGSTAGVLEKLRARLERAFPGLRIAGISSPPFSQMSEEQDRQIVDDINRSGASVVFVGLGCPIQEQWMAAHRGRIQATMIGVGAAFDYHAGTIKRAPVWAQRAGLEWLARLLTEPRRLWRRYLYTNSLFVYHALRELGRRQAK